MIKYGELWQFKDSETFWVERIDGDQVYLRIGGPTGRKPAKYPYPLKGFLNVKDHWTYRGYHAEPKVIHLRRWLDRTDLMP